MGDRISISFRKTENFPVDKPWVKESVALFSHWGGTGVLGLVREYAIGLKKWQEEHTKGVSYPLNRSEPDTVMIDFIRWLCNKEQLDRVTSDYYLGKDHYDGDNGDNGGHIFDLDAWDFKA